MERYTLEPTHLAKQTRVKRFANFQALESYLDHYASEESDTLASAESRDAWSGNATLAECMRMLRHGWKPPQEFNAAELTNRIKTISGEAERYGIQYDVTGDYLDMGAFMSGQPECWGYTTTETVPLRQIDVIVNLTASASVDAETMRRRGIAIAALVDVLRKRHEVTLKAVFVARKNKDTKNAMVSFEIETKNLYSSDLLYFYLAHPGFFRKIGFRTMEIVEEIYDCKWNKPDELQAGKDYDPKDTIYFESLHSKHHAKWFDDERTAREMAEIVKRYNETAAAE